jgi:hypothetical protein
MHQDCEESTFTDTPLCDAQIEKLRSVYDPLLLVFVFQFAKDLERSLRKSNSLCVDLYNRIEELEELEEAK